MLKNVRSKDGSPLVKGKQVTAFTNTEEEAVQLTKIVPFLVEDMLVAHGGIFGRGSDWESHVETDGNLVTGQNPASSEAVARKFITL